MIIKSTAIVIKSFSYSETSLISRVLLQNGSKMSLMIKGAKSLKSNKMALFQSMNFINMHYYYKDNREMQLFKEGEIINSFPKIKKTFETIKYGLAMIDIMDKVLPKDYQDEIMFDITYQYLNQIENCKNHRIIFILFLLSFTHYNGYGFNEWDDSSIKISTLLNLCIKNDLNNIEYDQLINSMKHIDINDFIQNLLLFIRFHMPEIKNVKSLKFVN